MVMAGRAVKLLGLDEQITKTEADAILAKFKDGEAIPAWARDAVVLCVKQNLISGQDGFLLPDGALTRAQTAAIAIRLSDLVPVGNP
ncbi:hypothetical protein D3C71_2087760 [compost metagenome]